MLLMSGDTLNLLLESVSVLAVFYILNDEQSESTRPGCMNLLNLLATEKL